MFTRHEPCPRCGSKDNLARYSDGAAWCFGCRYYEKADTPRYIFDRASQSSERKASSEFPRIPDDAGTSFQPEAVEWLAKFHVDVPTAIQHGLLWSPSRRQLIYQMGDVWQARNFDSAQLSKRKNFTSGDVNECRHIYSSSVYPDSRPSSLDQTLVIVEDPVSALRIAHWCDSMPLLGSHLATRRLNAIARLYPSMIFWLDSDKYRESREICQKAQMIGIEARSVYSDLDPKCYINDQLLEYLNVSQNATQAAFS